MAGTLTDSNDAEPSGEKPDKKSVKKSSVLSRVPRLTTLMRKKTEETTTTLSRSAQHSHDSQSSKMSPISKALASRGNILAKVVTNDTGYIADVDTSPGNDTSTIVSSPGPMSAVSDTSSAPWSSRASSGIPTSISTPGSSIHGNGKLPIRAGVLPSPESSKALLDDRRPSAARSITWNAQPKNVSHDSGEKATSSETDLIDENALARVVTFDNSTHFGPSARSSSCQYYAREDVRKSVTPWSDDPKWKLSQKAQDHQKAVLEADPESLPIMTKVQSAPEKSSSKLPVSKKKRISSSGLNFKANKQKAAMRMTSDPKPQNGFGKLKRAVPLPKEPEPAPEPMKDPGYDKWAELGKDQKTKQRRELVSGISSYNWSTALRHRIQPMASKMPIGPGGEVAWTETPPRHSEEISSPKTNTVDRLDAMNLADEFPTAGGISPRMVPATLPAAVEEAVEEEEEIDELSPSSSSSSASDSDSSTEPDSDSSAQNNGTKATRNRKLSKSHQKDSAHPSAKHSLNEPTPHHQRSGSIDLDLINSKLVKAAGYEFKLSSSIRPSATPPNAGLCGSSKLEMYRSNEDNGMCNGFESCAMSRKSGSGSSLRDLRAADESEVFVDAE